MPRVLIIASLFLALPAGASRAAEPARLGCDGQIARDATRASLVKLFGAKAVTDEAVDGVEGETLKATVLNAADPASRVEIFWNDEAARARPATVRLGEGSKIAIEGVTVGMDLKAVEALNGKPFALNGFGWDMGGNVVDWKSGRLGRPAGGCSMSVQFAPSETAAEKALDKVSGDKALSSADKATRAVSPKVQSLSFGWAAD